MSQLSTKYFRVKALLLISSIIDFLNHVAVTHSSWNNSRTEGLEPWDPLYLEKQALTLAKIATGWTQWDKFKIRDYERAETMTQENAYSFGKIVPTYWILKFFPK